jgi:starch synthase
MQKQFPHQLGIHLQPDFRLPRKIFGGTDMMVVPSLFEPGGIVALEGLRYGAVPIVRRTGGLNDIVTDFDPGTQHGNGFSFKEKDAWALYGTMIEAITLYRQPELWEKLVINCLRCDFSWDKVAYQYHKWYYHILEERRRAISELPHMAYQTVDTV